MEEQMSYLVYRGEVVDVGHCWAEVTNVWNERDYGVKLHPTEHGVMCPDQCRLLAAHLIRAAEYCERLNNRVLPKRRSNDAP
jgi:hypothetical protein